MFNPNALTPKPEGSKVVLEFVTKGISVKSVTGIDTVVETSVTLSVEFVVSELFLIHKFFNMFLEEIIQSERVIESNSWFWVSFNSILINVFIVCLGATLADLDVIIHSVRWNASRASLVLAFWGVELQIMTT